MNMHRITVFLILTTAVLCAACGYHLVGKGSVLPEHIRVIAVPYFENETDRAELNQRITERISEEFSRRGNYKIVDSSDGSDAVLQGTIKDYESKPVSFDADGRANRYEIKVAAEASFRDLKEGEVLWESTNYVFREEYNVADSAGDYFNREIEAIERLAEDFAESLVASITQGF